MTEPEQWAEALWDHLWNETFSRIQAIEAIQRAFEERERAGYDRALAVLGEALDHLLEDVELEDALIAVGISVYGPDATKFEKMFAAAMKCRARFVALATRQPTPTERSSDDQ